MPASGVGSTSIHRSGQWRDRHRHRRPAAATPTEAYAAGSTTTAGAATATASVTATASRPASAAVALAEEPLVLALAGVQHLTRWLLALPRTLLLPPRSSRDAASLPREFEVIVSRRSCLRVSASTSGL